MNLHEQTRVAEPDHEAEMKLPPGNTCGDCVHIRKCLAMFGHIPSDTYCDFWPSRYREAAIPEGVGP